jgi:hypothetical protein
MNQINKDAVTGKGLVDVAMPLFLIVYCLLTMIFTTGLFVYHSSLISRSLTTKEELKGTFKNTIGNPYQRSCVINVKRIFCQKISQPNMLEKIRRKIKQKELAVI